MKIFFSIVFLITLGTSFAQDLSSIYIAQDVNITKLLPEIKGLEDESGYFGAYIAIDNEYMVASAPNAYNRGGVAIYKKSINDWELVQMIDGASHPGSDHFGGSVDISGNRIIVGGYLSTFDNEDEGAVFIFELEDNIWKHKKTLTSPNSRIRGNFGSKVVLKNNVAIIAEKSGYDQPGGFYVYHINGSEWQMVDYIDDMDLDWQFGTSLLDVDFNDDYMVLSRYGSGSSGAMVRIYDLLNGVPQNFQVIDNPELTYNFGNSLSIDSDRLAIADYSYNLDAGVVYIYQRNAQGWYLDKTIYGPNADQDKEFGAFVRLKGNHLLVGSYGDDEVTSGAGAVFYFTFDGTEWSEQQKILPSDGDVYDNFGTEADFYNNDLVVGSWRADASTFNSGKAYSYSLNNMTWNESQIILPLPAANESLFSNGLAMNDHWIAVGADGDEDQGQKAGAVYLYQKDQGQINFVDKFYADEPLSQQQFGKNIVIDGDIMLISATGNLDILGYVHFYRLIEDEWVFQYKFKPADISATDYFGYGLSIDNNLLAVSALSQANGTHIGAVYLFSLEDNLWTEETKLIPDSDVDIIYFGYDLSLKGNRLAVTTTTNARVFVFENNGGLWNQTQQIVYPETNSEFYFGRWVELFENQLLIGTEFSPLIYEFTGNQLSDPIYLDETIDRIDQRRFNLDGNRLVLASRADYNSNLLPKAIIYEYIDNTWQYIHTFEKPRSEYDFHNDVTVFGNEVLIGNYDNSQRGYRNGAAYWINGIGDLIYKNGYQ